MFTIVITSNFIEERPFGKEWKVVSRDEDDKGIYGYTPEIMKKQECELKIYEQAVETMDIKKVIDAVNDSLPPLVVDESLTEPVNL